jgi:hypothetical protein
MRTWRRRQTGGGCGIIVINVNIIIISIVFIWGEGGAHSDATLAATRNVA